MILPQKKKEIDLKIRLQPSFRLLSMFLYYESKKRRSKKSEIWVSRSKTTVRYSHLLLSFVSVLNSSAFLKFMIKFLLLFCGEGKIVYSFFLRMIEEENSERGKEEKEKRSVSIEKWTLLSSSFLSLQLLSSSLLLARRRIRKACFF